MTDAANINDLIGQGIDPAVAEAMIKLGGYQAKQGRITDALRRHRRGYGGFTPGKYGRFVGDPLGALTGGFEAGRASAEQGQLESDWEAAMRSFSDSVSPYQASGTGAPPPGGAPGATPAALRGGPTQASGAGAPPLGAIAMQGGPMADPMQQRPAQPVTPNLQQPIDGSQAHPYGSRPADPWMVQLLQQVAGSVPWLGAGV